MTTTKAITAITIITPDHPNLLSIIAGCCAATEANIVDAQIFTMKDGRALDTIYITRAFDTGPDENRRGERIGELIEQVLSGETYLPDLLKGRTKPSGKVQAFTVSPKVEIDNSLSDKFTVIAVQGRDRPGLLSGVAGALADLNLNIISAHIATFGEKVTDTFYVTDLTGHKIERPPRMKSIRERLLDVLGGADKNTAKVHKRPVKSTAKSDKRAAKPKLEKTS